MADNNMPIEGSPADTANVTAFTYTSTSTPPLNTPSMRSFKIVTTSTEPAPVPILISTIISSRKQLRRITVVITLIANE